MRVRVLYFASLRDAAQCGEETFESVSGTLATLYDTARARHGFSWPRERLRVARNGAFADWGESVCENDEIAFIPPVAGG